MQHIEFFVPVKTTNESNGSHRSHWAVNSDRQRVKDTVAKAAWSAAHPTTISLPCVVKMIRLSAGVLDDDGLRSALKAARDGLASWLGIDDGKVELLQFDYAQEPCKRGQYGVRVQVYELARLVHEIVPAEPANDVMGRRQA